MHMTTSCPVPLRPPGRSLWPRRAPRSASIAGRAGCTRPTRACTRSSPGRGRAEDGRGRRRDRPDRRRGGGADPAAGAATSLSGQTVGPAVVIDFSKYMNRIGVVDRDAMSVRVEPGVVLNQLNAHLKPLGLMFGPDVSTSDRATLGGMIGNNSAGARSLRYGKTVDHVREVDVVLADGTPATSAPWTIANSEIACAREDRVGTIHRTVRDVVARNREAIRSAVPEILRRVSGYNLDEFIPGLPVRPDGWARRALAVQPGEADRRLGGDPGRPPWGRGGRGPAPGGAQGLVILSSRRSRRARPPGRDRRDRAGGRRDARPDDPGAGREEPGARAAT